MQEVRCECGKLLGYIEGNYEIKCPRCKKIIRKAFAAIAMNKDIAAFYKVFNNQNTNKGECQNGENS